FESLGQWGGNFLILVIVGFIGQKTGEPVWAAHIGGIRIEALSFLPGMALGEAASTLVGLYLGLGDPQRARRAGILCWFVAMTIMGLIGITFMTMPGWWIRLVTPDEQVINLAIPILWICGPIQVFFATYIVFSNA